jgi:putative serine protease PepD
MAGWLGSSARLRTVAGTITAIGAGVLLAPVAGLAGCSSSAPSGSSPSASIAGHPIAAGQVAQSGRDALGITGLGITGHTAVTFSGRPGGVTVAPIPSGGPAATAGLHAGDVIIALDGRRTATPAAFTDVLAGLKPGAKVAVTYTRSGTSHTATVILGRLSS